MTKKEFATLNSLILGEPISSKVRVLARAEGYAMVRHKGCVPFVVDEKRLTPLATGHAQQEANHV